MDRFISQLDQLSATTEHPVFPDVVTVAARLRRSIPSLSDEQAEEDARRLTRPCEGGFTWRWDPRLRSRSIAGVEAVSGELYTSMLDRFGRSVTLIYGTSGIMSDERSEIPKIPGVRQLTVAGGHNLHLDVPEFLAASISEAARGSTLTMSSAPVK